MKKLLQSLFILLFVASSAMAQNRTIAGTVTSKEDGLPVPGVSVKVKGTNIGVSTGANGKFSLSVPSNVKTLEISSIGFESQTVNLGTSNVINVSLAQDSKTLSEVMVVAYGTQKKEAIVGSVATIGTEDIEKRTVTNATQLLAGSTPGITTTAGNGQPGAGVGIRLRGFGSFAASSSPLIILDGAQYDGSIGDINVNDIDNLSILKDASSSALYGSRAANGVILITTKKGKSMGGGQLSASVNQGFSKRGTPEYDRVDAFEYYPAFWQAIKNNLMYSATPAKTEAAASLDATNTVANLLVYNPFNVANNSIVGVDGKINPAATLKYNDFDWYAPLERTGNRLDANVSFSGRNDKTDYFVSVNHLKDNGYILKSDLARYGARANVNTQVKSWLKTGANLSASFSDLNNASDAATDNAASFINVFNIARGMGPIYPVFARDANGAKIYNPATQADWYDTGLHPGAVARPTGASPGRNVVWETLLNENSSKRNNLGGRAYAEVRFLKDFTFTPQISMDIRNNIGVTFWSPSVGDGVSYAGYASNSTNSIRSYTFNQVLNYKKNIEKHNIGVLLGHENYKFTRKSFNASKTGVILEGNSEFANFVTPLSVGGASDNESIESYFSRATYNFDEKYFLEGSVRRDGSSRFSSDSRWGTFFSAGASWSISKEDFIKNQTWIDDLRAKVSYGEVGNNSLNTYYAYQALYDLGYNNGSSPGALLATLANPDLKWEIAKTLNAGLSFSLFKRKLYGELEYFQRGSSDLIFSIPQPLSDAVTSKLANIGSMENRGVELQLGSQLLKLKDFSWDLVTNWTILKNEITKMPVETPQITSGTKRREVGRDYYAYWLRQYAGVDPTDGSSLYIPADGVAPANIRTVNGQQYVTKQSFAKFDYSGTAIPDLIGSVSNTFSYKDFSLSFLVNYQIGGKFYDSNYQTLMSPRYGSALHKDVMNSWTTLNTGASIPRLDIGSTADINATSTRWLVDASYLSFTNVNLSYSLPKTLLGRVDVASAKIFLAGENLGVLSKRKGLDPRESFDGVNTSTYLPSRIVSFGINLSL